MTPKRLAALFALLVAPAFTTSCAASLCERRDAFMRNTCAGSNVTYTGDPMCERKVKKCNQAQLAQFQGYVQCLESQKVCSMEVLAGCAEKYPGGVNLACGM